jgi:Zn-dependent protease
MLFLSGLGSGFIDVLFGLIALIMAVFVAIPFHEFAHAYAAKREGDYTATACKRCTLRGLAHVDWSGFLLMMFFGFGWAKPVPVDERNFKRGNKSKFIVSIAGVLMNFILGIGFVFIYMLIYKFFPEFYFTTNFGYLLEMFLFYSISLNFGLAIFNLLPIYPLDGYNIIESFAGRENGFLQFMRRFSFLFFAIIVITDIYAMLYNVVVEAILNGLWSLFSLVLGL